MNTRRFLATGLVIINALFMGNGLYAKNTEESDPWAYVNGAYRGSYEGHQFIFVISTISIFPTVERKEVPDGTIRYRGRAFHFVCFKTDSRDKYEVRIKRPNNPALLGEYLSWRAYVRVKSISELELYVTDDLSTIEKAKYKLPHKGGLMRLELGPNNPTPY